MPLYIVQNDIAKMRCDAIVNAANAQLRPGSGVCGAIFDAADAPALEKACRALGGCPTGQAVATDSYGLPCQYIIHAVGPIWEGGDRGEAELLRSAYLNALRIMKEKGCRSGAFPLISSGIYGFPMHQALEIAVECLRDSELELTLVIFSRKKYLIGRRRYEDILSFINNNTEFYNPSEAESAECFSEMVLRLIREKNLDENTVYKSANLSREFFSEICSDRDVQPKKETALALAIALQLSLTETKSLLQSAGFTLSNSKLELIVMYFIQKSIFDIVLINEALFDFEQTLLGA